MGNARRCLLIFLTNSRIKALFQLVLSGFETRTQRLWVRSCDFLASAMALAEWDDSIAPSLATFTESIRQTLFR
jgi:hypothetical protein